MMTETTSETTKPPVKRALFNKPAWSRPQNLASPVDFFHRANSASLDPVVEAERKRKARAAKKEAEKARQKAEEQPAEKRRRVSGDDDDDLYGVSDQEVKPSFPDKPNGSIERADTDEGVCTSRKSSLKREPLSKSLSKRFEDETIVKEVGKKPVLQPSDIIDLEESDEDEDLKVTQVNKPPPPPPEEEDFPASDEEYAELVRKAREKARRKRLQDDILAETQKQPISLERDSVSQQSFSAQASTPPPPLDPEVFILVTSRLENAVPLIVKRKLSQRLKDVRLSWCFRNQFTEDMTSSIFLTWRGRRLFDVTSCKSLGIAVDKEGRVMAKDQEDVLADEERKIHMEAMTEDIYEAYQKAKRRATEQQDEDKDEEQPPPKQKPSEVQVKLVLKAKGFADFKVIAKPETTIARIVAGFRKANPAGTESREVYIVFDGNRLDPETKVAETELSDMDEVDVYVK